MPDSQYGSGGLKNFFTSIALNPDLLLIAGVYGLFYLLNRAYRDCYCTTKWLDEQNFLARFVKIYESIVSLYENWLT